MVIQGQGLARAIRQVGRHWWRSSATERRVNEIKSMGKGGKDGEGKGKGKGKGGINGHFCK